MADVDGERLVELFEKANKAADRAVGEDGVLPAEEARCTEALKAMSGVEVSTSVLLSTQVGKRLRKLTKHQSLKISASAQRLLDDWKKVVAAEAASKNGTSKEVSPSTIKPETPSRTPLATAVKKERITQLKVETKVTVTTRNTAPSPKTESESSSPLPRSVSQDAGKAPASTMPSGSTKGLSNGFAPKVGKVPKAGDSTRDRFRELVVEALSKVCNEATGGDFEKAKKADIVKVAVAVENALFSKLGLSKGNEKAKYRSIMFNLKDEKNPDFRRRVLLEEIKPEEIVTMTADDMASDQRKKENEGIREKALFECERGLQNVASTDQFRCGKCGQRKTTYFQLQTRSADEPMTTFVTCVNCNNRWKFC